MHEKAVGSIVVASHMSAVDLASARAECQHWRHECEHMKEKISSYDRAFGYLCAHMNRRSLCKAISGMKDATGAVYYSKHAC